MTLLRSQEYRYCTGNAGAGSKCERKRSLRLPASLRRQVQKSSSSNTRSKTPGRQQIEWRRRTGSGTRLVSTMSTAVVPGILNRLLEELVFCVWLLRGAASHEKRLPTRFASSSVISITIIILTRPPIVHNWSALG